MNVRGCTRIPDYEQRFQNMYRDSRIRTRIPEYIRIPRLCKGIPEYVQGFQTMYSDSRICTRKPDYV
jgi:hypothetical protein